jgi:hypothetical protein
MRPGLIPGDGLLTWRGGTPRSGQVRVFRDPLKSTRWLVKRVGGVRGSAPETKFEARSDNSDAPGASDSRDFGWIPAADTYRVLWTFRAPR